jgi:AcrR family transcriptional regulator
MVAERAGVSVGSVFTTFESKVDIFNYILFEKFEALFDELQRILPYLKGTARDRLGSLISICYSVECRQLELMVSHLSASYGWPRRIEDEHNKRRDRLMALFRSVLEQGVAAGELREGAELGLFLELLMAVYVRNYRKAFYEKLTAEQISAHCERQIAVLFDGIAAEPAAAAVSSASAASRALSGS